MIVVCEICQYEFDTEDGNSAGYEGQILAVCPVCQSEFVIDEVDDGDDDVDWDDSGAWCHSPDMEDE